MITRTRRPSWAGAIPWLAAALALAGFAGCKSGARDAGPKPVETLDGMSQGTGGGAGREDADLSVRPKLDAPAPNQSPPEAAADGPAMGSADRPPGPPPPDAQDPPPGETFVIAAAGDVAAPGGDQKGTAQMLTELLATKQLRHILMLGDGAYRFATMTEYRALYEPTWGVPALKAITHAIAGNHEYLQQKDAHGYFDYWNGAGNADGPAGPRGQGYYSFDLGPWHLVALNSNDDCKVVACGDGSPQLAWLKADLAAHPARCTLAMVHAPRYQDGTHRGDTPALQAAWSALYDAGVDLVLAAHEHNYQQFAPMDKTGAVDRAKGMRSFVVGTGGGQDFRAVFTSAHMAAEEKRIVNKSGILELTLSPAAFQWRFLLLDGSVGASGSDVCH
jgi:hypothetical protein